MSPGIGGPAGRSSGAAHRSRARLWCFRLLAVGLGLSPFAVAELICILGDWGRPSVYDDPFVGFSAVHRLFVLDEAAARYEIPKSRLAFFAPESFPAEKPANGYRIFCLGGSTVQGRPYSKETSFSTWLELALKAADGSREWDSINCGGVSYASYRLVPILQECLAYQPDLFVICTGHNEFLEERTYGDVKCAPEWVARGQRLAARSRCFTLLRGGLPAAGGGESSGWSGMHRPILGDETAPLLDHRHGLETYRRDDVWKAGVVAHYEFNLRRMIAIARTAGVPVLLVLPPSNLGDCPPFKSEHRDGMEGADVERWKKTVERARNCYTGDVPRAVEFLRQALEIDGRYALTWYELGKCLQAVGQPEAAREAFLQAREEDICPLRMTGPLEQAMRRVAADTGTPLLDAHTLLEERTKQGILGDGLLVDHVHPSPDTGHQAIANALVERMACLLLVDPQKGWETKRDADYATHFESLDPMYFLKGQRTLRAVRKWTQGDVGVPEVR